MYDIYRRSDHMVAFEDGKLSGLDPWSGVAECPFKMTQVTLREAWLDGFMIGRVGAALF